MKVALVYDRLNKVGGAEVVLSALRDLFPQADWYTSVWNPEQAPFSKNWRVHSSFLSAIPVIRNHHELFPFLMPFIFESFDLSAYDIVISVSSAECKGVLTKPGTLHLNYCLTPTRYLYSHRQEYLSRVQFGLLQRLFTPFLSCLFDRLQQWDQVAAKRPDKMISISEHVKNRVKKYYHRDTPVIYPPVKLEPFLNLTPSCIDQSYYLTVARLVPYKHLDLLVRIFEGTKRELIIVGTGSELTKLKKIATKNIYFPGFVAQPQLLKYYQGCRAFVQVNVEDFGLGMVEAQAAGKPVIAYQEGGAGEIIKSGQTGLLVKTPTVKAFRQAIDRFETMKISPKACRQNAARFGLEKWQQQITKQLGVYGK